MRLTAFILILLYQALGFSFESSLFDIELMSDYARTIEIMKSTFKYPHASGLAPDPFTTFKVSNKGHELTIFSNELNRISKIRIAGDTPLDKLNFVGSINLGSPPADLEAQAGLPAVSQTKSDGSRVYVFGNSNFAIETKAGKITSISIYITNRNKIISDNIKNYCRFRHPIWQQGDFFYTQLNIDYKGQTKMVVAQINTGSKKSYMSQDFCRKFSCKANQLQSTVLMLGNENDYLKKEFLAVDTTKVLGRSFDISLGTDYLFWQPMILNLQHDYICKPRLPLEQISSLLQMAKISPKKDDDGYLIPIKLLGTKSVNMRLDSGNRDMALDQKSINFLKSSKVPLMYFPGSGRSLGSYSGRIKYQMGSTYAESEKFFVSPLPKYQKIGSKQMTDYIWGFDIRNQAIYLKK